MESGVGVHVTSPHGLSTNRALAQQGRMRAPLAAHEDQDSYHRPFPIYSTTCNVPEGRPTERGRGVGWGDLDTVPGPIRL